MKNSILISSIALLLFVPFAVSAHTAAGGDSRDQTTGSMMQSIEHQVLSDDEHEQLEELMIKMMRGTLTEAEEEELGRFMQDHPGAYGMMMDRFGGGSGWMSGHHGTWNGWGGGMMSAGGWWPWMIGLSVLATLVWVGVGIALIVFIVRRLRNNK